MMNLAEYRRTATRLADFLPWTALVGEGVVLNKDGSFQRTAQFRGPDLDSAVPAELVAVAGRLNNAFRRLGSGWAIFVEAQRHPAGSYPASRFPEAASALVDAERKADFEEAGAHFESSYFLTFLYLPPAEEAARAETWLYEGREHVGVDPWEILRGFVDRTDRVLQLIEGFMPQCHWLDDAGTLTYLHATVSMKRYRVRVPETPIYLDALLADQPFTGGLEPRLGSAHLRILTIVGFPSVTTPGILDELNRLSIPYRWSTRAVMLDKTDAVRLLTKIRRQWFAKRKSIAAILKEVMTNEQSALVDTDAANKAVDADLALQELGADYAGMAYVTATVTVSLLGLGIFGPGIANGIVSGGPQLGAGAAVGTGLAAGGAAVAAGGGAMLAARGGAAAIRGGAAVAGGASTAYSLASAGQSGAAGIAAGLGGVARAGGAAAISPLRRAAQSISDSYQRGGRAAAAPTGGVSTMGTVGGDAGASAGPPGWAQRMQRGRAMSHGATATAHAVRSGDSRSPGSSINLSEGDRS